jgi:hypothetical protein
MCRQEVDADEAMPHNAKRHKATLTAEEVRAGKVPVECLGSGFPTKKNVGDVKQFVDTVQQVF